eukprot:scaffold15141_cov81-Skeletonema_marinoi.AAC.7
MEIAQWAIDVKIKTATFVHLPLSHTLKLFTGCEVDPFVDRIDVHPIKPKRYGMIQYLMDSTSGRIVTRYAFEMKRGIDWSTILLLRHCLIIIVSMVV